MAKLYFRYGVVGSAKTLNLVAVAHAYRQQGKRVVVVKPALDTRYGERRVRSRSGLEVDADVLVDAGTRLEPKAFNGAHCILVDEAQFLPPVIVEQLRGLSMDSDIPVICYGLRSDFRGELFLGSKRLLELADAIEEIKSTCHFCNRKATMNLKHCNGVATTDGESIQLGGEELFLPACYACYRSELSKAFSESNFKKTAANNG